MEIEVYKADGSKTGRTVKLNENVFGIEPNDHVLYLDVKHYMANQRQGTSSTKEKWAVAHSTKKIKKQKGTGGARAGSIKSPVFKGGGSVFGPQPREYNTKLNKKVKLLARLSALSYKAKESNIIVVENLSIETPKTKLYKDFLNNFNIFDKKSLIVLGELNKNVYLSSRNLSKSKVVTSSNLNTYDVLNCQTLVLEEKALDYFNSNLLGNR
ncbi:MAG: 50S ribosomal protein L4 [Bacteroidetes bacterium ADurb.Bin408]|nr:MAG: 50S ribosomal protein L4 [Bacteroidetes bacterium ADurb.Bin408]